MEIAPEDTVWHRRYVGANWDAIGRLQFDFLVAEGLRPHHTFVDVACGSLRGGVHFIPYLETGHYLGLERQEALIAAGLEHELDEEVRLRKKPEFVVSDDFDFQQFSRHADYGLAQSLFTHLTPPIIRLCLERMRTWSPACRFYVTYFEGDSARNLPSPDDHQRFFYSPDEMAKFAAETGWTFRHIGGWNHPRGQSMSLFS